MTAETPAGTGRTSWDRVLLATEDAHAVYASAGSAPLAEPDKWMALGNQ